MMATEPALRVTKVSKKGKASEVVGARVTTYKMPRLIATATPTFSFFFICRSHSVAQGSRARTKSVAAEYTAGVPHRQRAYNIFRRYPNHPPMNSERLRKARPVQQFDGIDVSQRCLGSLYQANSVMEMVIWRAFIDTMIPLNWHHVGVPSLSPQSIPVVSAPTMGIAHVTGTQIIGGVVLLRCL